MANLDVVTGPEPKAAPPAIELLREQIAQFLEYATEAALQPLLASDLPLVGEALSGLVTGSLLAPLRVAIDDALAAVDNGVASVPQAIANAINDVGGGFAATVEGTNVRITLVAADSVSVASDPLDIDIGYDALGFELQGGVSGALGYAIDGELLFNTGNGRLTVVDKPGDVITLSLEASLDDLAGEGSLGFLTIDVADENSDPEIQLTAGVDIEGVRVSQLTADSLDMEINGSVKVDFALAASLDGSEPGEPSPLPRIFTDLDIRYAIADFDPASGLSGLGATPSIALRDIELDVGTLVQWLGEVLSPITETIFGAYALEQLLDAITAPIPLLDQGVKAIGLFDVLNIIEDNRINLLDLAAAGAPESKPIIEAFSKAYNLIKGLAALADEPALGGGSRINFGDRVLVGDAPQGFVALADGDFLAGLRDVLDDIDTPDTGGLDNGGGTLGDLLDGSGFSIPLLESPDAVIGLLLNGLGGAPVDLVRYDVPELAFTAGFSQFFPIIGPIGVSIYGQFGAGIDIEIGYDTSGLAFGNLADGFFITTEELADPRTAGGSTVYFDSAGYVDAELGASAGVNIGIAEVSVGGGVFAGLDAYFEGATTQGDGKLRLSDLSGCVFDPIVGEFGVVVQVTFRIGIGPFSYTKRFDIVRETLATFEFGCDPETEPNNGLATFTPGLGRLTLNAGESADRRVIAGQVGQDTAESYVLRAAPNGAVAVAAFKLLEINGHPAGGEPADDGEQVNLILARMGDGDDQAVLLADVTVAAQLFGDDGNDLLQGGAGKDLLRGGTEDDRLIGQGGADDLEGGDGDDVLEGGAGADDIDGGDDFDQVTYENSKVGVVFRVSADDEDIFVGFGGEAAGDRVTDVEHIVGSHFDDRLYGDPDDGGVLEGLDGNDVLIAGEDDDLLLGGGGADTMKGGDGDDTISFVTSSGQIYVNLATGNGSSGDAAGDSYSSIENVHGSNYDDVIIGTAADNKIEGWNGDDIITGGGGEDEIRGEGGDDLIYGSADGGVLDGGGLINAPGEDTLSYAKVGFGVEINLLTGEGDDETTRAFLFSPPSPPQFPPEYSTFENLIGSNFADSLTGDWQDNRIDGGANNDAINGSEGDDVMVGGAGADSITGGGGRDLADYSASTAGVTVALTGAFGVGGHAAGDQLFGIEDLLGTRYADALTGGGGNNRIDPGLVGSSAAVDTVDGGADGLDTLAVNYGARDIGRGITGGFDVNSSTNGAFQRLNSSGANILDRVTFQRIDRVEVVGTVQTDLIYGGGGNDVINTGSGVDLIVSGLGFDRVDAGDGGDLVAVGTNAARQYTSIRTTAFGDIRGGAGIDQYALSLEDSTTNLELTGLDGTTEFWGTNFTNATGSAISEFEVLLLARTGSGDDLITQPGSFQNNFATGFGVDTITPGLSIDTVDGGQDFRLGSEVTLGGQSGNQTVLNVVAPTNAAVFANPGDLLKLDYRGGTQGMTSTVAVAATDYVLRGVGQADIPVTTNNGTYRVGNYAGVNFTNIERVAIEGTGFNDQMFGMNLTYGLNAYAGRRARPDASLGKRADDVLKGYAGNDTIVGGTGDDTISGGVGDDLIYGSTATPGRSQPEMDKGEIDRLRGDAGRDVFVLGNIFYSYYDDQVKGQSGNTLASTSNRAVIADFVKGEDKLILASFNSPSPAAFYRVEEKGGNTFIYLADGRTNTGAPNAAADELVAELTGVRGFDLKAAYVVYQTSSTARPFIYGDGSPAPNPIPAGAPSPISAPSPLGEELAAAPADPLDAALAAVTAREDAPTTTATNWITQTTDLQTLDAALWGGDDDPFFDGILTIEGYGAGIGVFKGDPFGLGEGVIISTGRVTELEGKNLIDGGRQPQQTVQLVFEDLGTAPDNSGVRIYRANLSSLGFDINSLRLGDSGSGFAGSPGSSSGFDIDAVVLSRQKVDSFGSVAQFNGLQRVNAFSFNVADTEFTPGDLRAPTGGGVDLDNTINGLPNFGRATLKTLDFAGGIGSPGYFSLGDNGSLGLDLNQTVSTDEPLYLYIAEAGAQGESITSGFTASASRLDAPADLSTDLGAPGGDDDVTALVYRFNGRGADKSSTSVAFDFMFFSEEFAEFAQSNFNDKFKITLNGVNMTTLSSGAFGSVSTIFTPPAGPTAQSSIFGFYTEPLVSDYIGNPVEGGPLAGEVRADGFTRTLRFFGEIDPGEENILRIEVSDTGDGLLDSGLLISGKLIVDSEGEFVIDRNERPLREGEIRNVGYRIELPSGVPLDGDVTVTFRPDRYVDLGAGAGVAITDRLSTADLDGTLKLVVTDDGRLGTERTDLVKIEVSGLPGTTAVAPLAIDVVDRVDQTTYTLGDAPSRLTDNDPDAWLRAWTREGVEITHTADASVRAPSWSAVRLDSVRPDTLPGGDIYRGDLGVSGVVGTGTGIGQDIAGSEGLRFRFASGEVTELSIDFARFDLSDEARVQLYDASGRLRLTRLVTTAEFDLSGLSDIATMVVTASKGGFEIDSVTVTELADPADFARAFDTSEGGSLLDRFGAVDPMPYATYRFFDAPIYIALA